MASAMKAQGQKARKAPQAKARAKAKARKAPQAKAKAQGQKARKATKAMKGAPFMWSKSWQTVFRGRSGRLNVDELVNLQIDFGSCKVTETWKRHG